MDIMVSIYTDTSPILPQANTQFNSFAIICQVPIANFAKFMERAMGFEPTTASLEGWRSSVELRPQIWWAGKDSNLRRRMPADLQSAPFNHSGTCPK